VLGVRVAPVPPERAPEPDAVLDPGRPVEAPQGAQPGDRLGGGGGVGGEDVGRTAPRRLEEQEEDDGDEEEAGAGPEEPAPEEAERRAYSRDQSAAFQRLPATLGA
jgi:hypothetical protein